MYIAHKSDTFSRNTSVNAQTARRKPEEKRYKQKGKRVEHNDPQPKRKAGWAKPKPKKNARPGKGRRS